MAKTAAAPKAAPKREVKAETKKTALDPKNNAVTVATPAGVPAHLAKAAKYAGAGTSQAAEDNLIPLIYVLQTNSPQVNQRDERGIKGAAAGDIWLRNYSDPIVKGDEGLLFQPCYFHKDWVEWVPRSKGGGFVGRHPERPETATQQALDPQRPDRLSWVLPNGNEVKETRYHIGFAILEDGVAVPFTIPMTSTGHTASRAWMVLMNAKRIGDAIAPSWACLYRLKTTLKTKGSDSWFMLDVEDAGWVESEADFDRGLALHQAFAAGEKKIADEDEDEAAAGTGTGDGGDM